MSMISAYKYSDELVLISYQIEAPSTQIPYDIVLKESLIIKCSPDVGLNIIRKQMGGFLDWMPDILLRADGYETNWHCKD